MNQYCTLVATNPLGMPRTREHNAVYSRLDPLSDDEDGPCASPFEEEKRENLTQVSDIEIVPRHSQAGDGDIVSPSKLTPPHTQVIAVLHSTKSRCSL